MGIYLLSVAAATLYVCMYVCRGKWGKADYLRKNLDLCFVGCCFLPVIMPKGKSRISALIFLWQCG